MLGPLKTAYRNLLPLSVRAPLSRALNWPEGSQVSFAAFGEDLLVRGFLDDVDLPRTSMRYLDIGASHPTLLSNTYTFYRAGASGVLVEPTPQLATQIETIRPRDTLISAGVAFDDRDSATLFQFWPPFYNTFDPAMAEEMRSHVARPGSTVREVGPVDVPLISINDLARQHFPDGSPCHFMSIDIEGLDSIALLSIDLTTFRPWIICTEKASEEATKHLEHNGYLLRCRTPHNILFTRDDVIRRSQFGG